MVWKKYDQKGVPSLVSWSPNAERLLLQFTYLQPSDDNSYYIPRHEIYLVGPDGKNSEYLTNGQGAGWSPDGKRIAYFSYDDSIDSETFYIYTINIDGSNKKKLYTYHNSPQLGNWLNVDLLGFISPKGKITWAPDGFHIAFAATKTTAGLNPAIYVLNILTKKLAWVSIVGGGSAENPVWIPLINRNTGSMFYICCRSSFLLQCVCLRCVIIIG